MPDTFRPISGETQTLFHNLCDKFNDNILREIVLASAGLKVSRTCMYPQELEFFLPLAQENNLQVVLSENKYVHLQDMGKGGWSNSIERVVPSDYPDGMFNVYMASDVRLAELSLHSEELSDEDSFGLLLGIPECCREAYLRFQPLAQLKQNDFVPLVLDNTRGTPPYNFWNNYVSQYFGRTILSFFPCSFNCSKAARVAQITFAVLQQCSEVWAKKFIKIQKTNILYTEYRGLHLFHNTDYSDGWIDYDNSFIQSTGLSEVREQLDLGDRLKVLSKHHIAIYSTERFVSELKSKDISMCILR